MSYYTKVPLGPYVSLFEGIIGSSCPIIWKYHWIIMSYYLEISLDPHDLLKPLHRMEVCRIIEAQPQDYNSPNILQAHLSKMSTEETF